MALPGLFAFLIPLTVLTIAGLVLGLHVYEQRPKPLTYHERDDKDKRRGRGSSSVTINRSNESNNTLQQRIRVRCGICGENIPQIESKLPCNDEFHENCILRHFNRTKNDAKIALCPAPGCSKEYSFSV